MSKTTEIGNSKSAANSKHEHSKRSLFARRVSDFGFRICFGFRYSDFGFILAIALVPSTFSPVCADEKADSHQERVDPYDILAAMELRLTDKQKEQIRALRNDSLKKADPANFRLWATYKEEQKALLALLTDAQKAKLLEVLRAMRAQDQQRLGDKLDLNDAQRQRLAKLADEYEPKFRALVGHEGDTVHKAIADLRLEFRAAVRSVLTEAQRAKLPRVLRESPGMPAIIRDDAGLAFVLLTSGPAHFAQHDYFATFAGKLDLSAEQQRQFQKIAAEYGPAIQKSGAALLAYLRQQTEDIEKLLTDDQRAQWRQIRKTKGDDRN